MLEDSGKTGIISAISSYTLTTTVSLKIKVFKILLRYLLHISIERKSLIIYVWF